MLKIEIIEEELIKVRKLKGNFTGRGNEFYDSLEWDVTQIERKLQRKVYELKDQSNNLELDYGVTSNEF